MTKRFITMLVLLVNASAAPFLNHLSVHQPIMDHQMLPMDRPMINQMMINQMMEQQIMEQLVQQNQHNALQQQLIAMQPMPMNALNGPMMLNLPPQSIVMFLPNAKSKTSNRFDDPNETDQPDLKLYNEDSDSVVIDAATELKAPIMEMMPRQAIVVLPNGQRLFIGNIISAIPFLPFEVNVPDTIAWMYNGIAGIIGGIGQRLPFRPKPTSTITESPTASSTSSPMQNQESVTPMEESRLKWLQKVMTRKQSGGMPILMLPVAQPVPIQLPIQV